MMPLICPSIRFRPVDQLLLLLLGTCSVFLTAAGTRLLFQSQAVTPFSFKIP